MSHLPGELHAREDRSGPLTARFGGSVVTEMPPEPRGPGVPLQACGDLGVYEVRNGPYGGIWEWPS